MSQFGNCFFISLLTFIFSSSQIYGNIMNPTSVRDVKREVMLRAKQPLANLAHELGYGWVSGCHAEYVGEGYAVRNDGSITELYPEDMHDCQNATRWESNARDRPRFVFYDWDFEVVDVEFSEPTVLDVRSMSISEGIMDNWHSDDARQFRPGERITVGTTNIDSVTSGFQMGMTSSLEFGAGIPLIGGQKTTVSISISGSYSKGKVTEESNRVQFEARTSADLCPYTRQKFTIQASRMKSRVSFNARVKAKFKVKVEGGFLRWSGNYHSDRPGDRRIVTLKIGDGNYNFAEDLRYKTETGDSEFDWGEMLNNHPDRNYDVRYLTNEDHYSFNVSGDIDYSQIEHFKFDLKFHEVDYNSKYYSNGAGDFVDRWGNKRYCAVNAVFGRPDIDEE